MPVFFAASNASLNRKLWLKKLANRPWSTIDMGLGRKVSTGGPQPLAGGRGGSPALVPRVKTGAIRSCELLNGGKVAPPLTPPQFHCPPCRNELNLASRLRTSVRLISA